MNKDIEKGVRTKTRERRQEGELVLPLTLTRTLPLVTRALEAWNHYRSSEGHWARDRVGNASAHGGGVVELASRSLAIKQVVRLVGRQR